VKLHLRVEFRIFIGLGIWALAMTQVFEPSNAVASGDDCGTYLNPCYVKGEVSAHISEGLQTNWIGPNILFIPH